MKAFLGAFQSKQRGWGDGTNNTMCAELDKGLCSDAQKLHNT